MDEKSILEALMEGSSGDVMNLIYQNVNQLLGAGSQFFAMEFPARPLNARDYEYNTLTKPYTVQEKEFLLSDQLYDLSPVVQSTNGERLSTVFDTVLNNYVPRLEALKSFVSDQKSLREWLLTPVKDEEKPKPCPAWRWQGNSTTNFWSGATSGIAEKTRSMKNTGPRTTLTDTPAGFPAKGWYRRRRSAASIMMPWYAGTNTRC